MLPDWLNIQDPLVQKIVVAAAGFIVLMLALRIWSGRREAVAAARRRKQLRRDYETVRLQKEEIEKLAAQIEATSSTSRIAGLTIVRQIETVFSDARPSSVAAVELAKALAVQKGGNALINLQTQQAPGGKWFASADAVIVRPPRPAPTRNASLTPGALQGSIEETLRAAVRITGETG